MYLTQPPTQHVGLVYRHGVRHVAEIEEQTGLKMEAFLEQAVSQLSNVKTPEQCMADIYTMGMFVPRPDVEDADKIVARA